ncbi:hypothetical protein WA026_001672 [Henosepilachna vigintioctopunctata]|uniref:MYND-type domain-containing protein n=1 Tax=Henosepilachna vigintioctopunctata TaxID=420089 RepID=A0AAW1UVA0_9CUCU
MSNRLHIRDPMNNRHYSKNRMPPVGRSRRFTASSTRTASEKYEIKTRGKPTHDPNKSSLLNIDDKCMETTSSVKGDKEIYAVKSLRKCANVSTVAVESRKKCAVNLKTSELKCHTARSLLEPQVVGSVNSNIKKAKNKISKHSIDIKKAIRCTIKETTGHNSSTSNYEAVEPKNSSTMTTLSDPNSLLCKTSSKIYTNIADSDSTSTQTRSAKRKDECRKPKHSTTPTVKKFPHQNDPRLTAIVNRGTENTSLKKLKVESIRRSLDIKRLDNELVTGPVSPNDKSASSMNKSSKTDHPYRPNSIKMKHGCDFKQSKSEVSDSQTSRKTKTIECNNSFKRDENSIRRDAKNSISASNLEEHISKNLQNESKQVTAFDKEQDEEMKFVPEPVKELNRNSKKDIVKNSADNFRRKYPFRQTSLTCEDAYVTPKPISNRRKTIHFSSFLKDTEISKNNTPALSCLSVIAETSPLTAMTNPSNHLEQLKQFETPNNTPQDVSAETTQLITKEVAMIDVSNHSEKTKQVRTLRITCQDGDVSGSEIISNVALEANSDHEQQIIVPKNENKFLKITKSPSHISPENNLEKCCARFSPGNENRQMMSDFIEKEVTERDTEKTLKEFEFCTNLKNFKKGYEECCVEMKTVNSIHALTQIESESHNETGERDVNMKICSAPFSYKDVKRKKLSMPKLEVTERRQIKKKASRDITELNLKFATSLEKEDNPKYVQSSKEAHANHEPAAPLPSQTVPNLSDQNQSPNPIILNFYSLELGRIYYPFYDKVVYVLKGYIPLHKAYRISYKIVYDTFRRFPHSFNNFSQESLNLDMSIQNRMKLCSRYLLDAILKLPTDLPQFNFTHFLRLITQLLNRSGIPVSVPVVVQHLLAVMLACNLDYKQNKTSDIFKKNLEFFSDAFDNKNGTYQPEFGMTFSQRCLLKMQVLTYLQLYQNQKIFFESSKLLHHSYSRQQHYLQNVNSNNIQQTFGTCRNEYPTNETQNSVIQNSNQSNVAPMQVVVRNTRNITSSSSRQPPTSTSDRNNCTFMNVTIPMNYPIQTNSINSVTDEIKISENPPVNTMSNNQVLPILPMINSSVPGSRIQDHSSSLQVIPQMTPADVPYTVKKEQTPLNEFNIDVINGKSSGEAKKYESSDNCVGSTSLAVKIKEEIVEKFPFCEDKINDDHTSLGVKIKEEFFEKFPFSEDKMNDDHTSLGVKIKEEFVEKFPFSEDKMNDDHTSLGVQIKEEIVEKFPFCDDEIIDLTWIDDFNEEELRKEDNGYEEDNGFMCIKEEPSVICTEVPSSPEDSGMDSPPIQMEYPLLILENRLCLCGKTANYLCHCNTVMYCSQECQFTDWPKHRKGCHSSSAT